MKPFVIGHSPPVTAIPRTAGAHLSESGRTLTQVFLPPCTRSATLGGTPMTATSVHPAADAPSARHKHGEPAPRRKGARSQRTFRPDIQGLRAVAVLLVVLYHAGLPGLRGGFVGVDVFFVISGFLITGQLSRELERTGRISLLAFYARRARRLLPPATLVVVTSLVV